MTLRFSSRRSFPLLSIAALLGVACSSGGNTTGGGGSPGTGGTSSSTTNSTSTSPTTTSGTGGSPCPGGPGYMGSNMVLQGLTASATLNDLNGAPASGVVTFLCGTDICTQPAMSNAQGSVSLSWAMKMTQPAFKWGDALTWTELAIPVTTASNTFGTLTAAALPAQGAAFMPGGDTVSGGVTITLPAGDNVVVDTLTYDTADKQKFRAVQIPVAKVMPVVQASGLALEMLFGIAPNMTTFCPQAKVTVPNTPGWPAGTAVEFYGLGLDVAQEWAPYGGWGKIGEGTVSADGSTVSTADGSGFPVLMTFGVRKKM